MSTYSADDLRQLLDLHRRWLDGEDGGQRAYLSGANLSCADLSRADLRDANLRDAYLSGANLSGQPILRASCSWTAHGECGRTLQGVALPDDAGVLRIALSCGCFCGSPDELREYIARGEERYRASRTTALEFVLARMAEMGVAS